jgi:hypothetical protein
MSLPLSIAQSPLTLVSILKISCLNKIILFLELTLKPNLPMSYLPLSSIAGYPSPSLSFFLLLYLPPRSSRFRLRAKDSKVTVFAVHPGAVLTDVTRSLPYLIRLAHTIFTPFMLLLQVILLSSSLSSYHDPFPLLPMCSPETALPRSLLSDLCRHSPEPLSQRERLLPLPLREGNPQSYRR